MRHITIRKRYQVTLLALAAVIPGQWTKAELSVITRSAILRSYTTLLSSPPTPGRLPPHPLQGVQHPTHPSLSERLLNLPSPPHTPERLPTPAHHPPQDVNLSTHSSLYLPTTALPQSVYLIFPPPPHSPERLPNPPPSPPTPVRSDGSNEAHVHEEHLQPVVVRADRVDEDRVQVRHAGTSAGHSQQVQHFEPATGTDITLLLLLYLKLIVDFVKAKSLQKTEIQETI